MPDDAAIRELVRRKLLGWGLACEETLPHGTDIGRDLVLGPPDADGLVDFAQVEGTDNLGQSLTVALTTLLGSDVFNTSYGWDGLNALATETNPVLVRERVRVSVVQLLRMDPRVRRITDVNLAGGGDQVPAAGSRELNVTVAFETVAQEQTTLNLGKVVAGG